MQWCTNQVGTNMSIHNNNSMIITEKECDWCGKTFAYTGKRSMYAFQHVYREGRMWFCCESCMRKYQEARKELMDNKRKNRYANKK